MAEWRPAPRIPAVLARRIDRAARAAHFFHRYAHHPLCGRYIDELVRIGGRRRRVFVCAGCALTALGLAAGLALGAALGLNPAFGVTLAGVAALLPVTANATRLPKTLGRFAPAFFAGIAFCSGLLPAVIVAASALALAFEYRRRGPYREPCMTCPERRRPVCSGLAPIVRRERAFHRLTRGWLAAMRRPTPTPRVGSLRVVQSNDVMQ